ncbi:MAG: GAF domain-containing protein, partial [bacterium]|nr:GAF domain-containing protein [bacterium]
MPECKTKSLASGFEVWTPDADDSKLTWSSGVYDDIEAFEQVSRTTVFEHGASFLGRVWQERTPMLFADLFQMEFKRFEAARSAGITSAVAWPIIDGDRVTAVVNILCNHSDGATGAFELWKREERAELGLQGEYYANIDQVSTVSQFVKFPSGSGLPGSCWEERSPRLIRGLGRGSGFVRGSEMALSGIELGLAIPVMRSNFDLEAVVLMLSSKATPVARVTEIWRPDA